MTEQACLRERDVDVLKGGRGRRTRFRHSGHSNVPPEARWREGGMQRTHMGYKRTHMGYKRRHVGHSNVPPEALWALKVPPEGRRGREGGMQRTHMGYKRTHMGYKRTHMGYKRTHMGYKRTHMGCRGHIWDIRGHIWDAEDTESPGCDARVQCYFKYFKYLFFYSYFCYYFCFTWRAEEREGGRVRGAPRMWPAHTCSTRFVWRIQLKLKIKKN